MPIVSSSHSYSMHPQKLQTDSFILLKKILPDEVPNEMLEPWAQIIRTAVKPALLTYFIFIVYINFDAFVRRRSFCKQTFGTSKRVDLPANLPLLPQPLPPPPFPKNYRSNVRTVFSCGLI